MKMFGKSLDLLGDSLVEIGFKGESFLKLGRRVQSKGFNCIGFYSLWEGIWVLCYMQQEISDRCLLGK